MNRISTLVHCFVFLGLFGLAATADLWMNTKGETAKPIEVIALNEDEISETNAEQTAVDIEAIVIPPLVIEQLYQVITDEKDINKHQWFETSTPMEKLAILHKLVKQLHVNKQYRVIVNLLQTQPENSLEQVRFYYGLALSKLGNAQGAIKQYQAHIELYPNHQSATLNLGLLLKKAKSYEKAVVILTKAVDISSGRKKAKALALLAASQQQLGNKKVAEEHYSKSIEYRPNHAATWLKLANIMAELNRPREEVEKTFKRAIALDKKQLNAWLKFGKYALQNGKFSLAENTLTRALHLSSEHQDVRLQLAWALSEKSNWQAAKQHWSWLQHQSTSFEVQVLASHFYSAITEQSTTQLHPLPDNDQGQYASYFITKLQGYAQAKSEADATTKLERIKKGSDWHHRASIQLEQLKSGSWQDTQLVNKN